MGKARLEAFSDGVIAILITIMVLEMKTPHENTLTALKTILPVFLSYVLSFINIAIYWNNHHHMLHTVSKVNGKILWANMHLLFWLSMVPFATSWMGENHLATWPVVVYGFVLFMAGAAYYLLAHSLTLLHGKQSELARALGKDKKGVVSLIIYALGMGMSFIHPWWGLISYALVAAMWFIPDKRIEHSNKIF